MRTRAKKKYVASDRTRRENVLRHILSYMIGNCVLSYKNALRDRTAAEWRSVAKATRRRRRILRAGFYFIIFYVKDRTILVEW